jgi:hypothetical protein
VMLRTNCDMSSGTAGNIVLFVSKSHKITCGRVDKSSTAHPVGGRARDK